MIFHESDFWWRERWPATIATLIAIGLFWLSNGTNPMIVFLLVVWLTGYFFTGRVTTGPVIVWTARIVLYSIVYFTNMGRETTLVDTIFLAPAMSIFAQWAIAEFALRRWRTGSVPLWADILPSGVIMLAACSTTGAALCHIPWHRSISCLSCSHLRKSATGPMHQLPWRWLNLGTRILSLLLALAIGGFAHYCFRQYKSEILDWGGNVLGERMAAAAKQVSITGISKTPQLGPTFNADAPPARMLLIHGTLPSPYLRGMAYSDYLRGTWGPGLDGRRYARVGPDSLTIATSTSASSIEVERLISDDGMVAYPLETSAIRLPKGDEVTWAQNDGGPLRVTDIGNICTTVAHCRRAPTSKVSRARLRQPPSDVGSSIFRLASTSALFSLAPL